MVDEVGTSVSEEVLPTSLNLNSLLKLIFRVNTALFIGIFSWFVLSWLLFRLISFFTVSSVIDGFLNWVDLTHTNSKVKVC